MHITKKIVSDTEITLEISASEATLKVAKQHALNKLSKSVKVTGFREGKAPASLVEKAIDQNLLAEEFLTEALNHAYGDAVRAEGINPVTQPTVEVTKFVPFTQVEFIATVKVIGDVKLADYKNLKAKRTLATITKTDVDKVLENMQTQLAERKDVERECQDGDQVWIDFEGFDEKGQAVKGAKGDNYPLVLGSNTFIPGFEAHLIGLKAGDKKDFNITFPKDYGVKALQSKKVTFKVGIVKVQEVQRPTIDEALVAKVAPELKTVDALKADIKKQLQIEAETNSRKAYENALVAELVEVSDVSVPEELITEQAENVMRDLQQNIAYRGQTYEEYLEALGMTAEEQRIQEVIPEANRRLKAGILLSEIAEKEGIAITPEELQQRVQELTARYPSDAEMQKQIASESGQREIGAQMITEKTVARLVELNSK
jgi:trigger factor